MTHPTFDLYIEYLEGDGFLALFLTPEFKRFHEQAVKDGFNLVCRLADPGVAMNRRSEMIRDYTRVVDELGALFGPNSSEVFRARVSSNFYGRVIIFRREEDVVMAKLANLITEDRGFLSWIDEK